MKFMEANVNFNLYSFYYILSRLHRILRLNEGGLTDHVVNFATRNATFCTTPRKKNSDDVRVFDVKDFEGLIFIYLVGEILK